MIEINLLPERLKKKKHAASSVIINLPKEIIIGLVGGLVVLLVMVHLILLTVTVGMNLKLSGLNKEWSQLKPGKQEADAIKQEKASIEANMKSIVSLKGRTKVSWSNNFNLISDDMVRGVWLTRIYFGEGTLKLEGSAVSKKGEEMINVGKFAANLKEDKNFHSLIKNLELTSIQRRSIKSIEVVDFVITAGIKE